MVFPWWCGKLYTCVYTCIPQACVHTWLKTTFITASQRWYYLRPLFPRFCLPCCFILYRCSQPYSCYLLVRENMYITDHHWSQNQSFSDMIISDASIFQAFVNFTMHLLAVTPGAYIIEIIMQCCRYTRSVCVTWLKWVIPVSSQNRYYNSYYIHGHIVWSVFLLRIWDHNYSRYKKYW